MSKPRALSAPSESVVVLDRTLVETALAASRESERRRVILPFHKSHEERLHRMFNALQPGTYVQPHRHLTSDKSEVFLLLKGALDFLLFDESGALTRVERLAAGSDAFGIDVMPGHYHGFVVREPDTLIYEVKPGPWVEGGDKDFAPWAPPEGAPDAARYAAALEQQIAALRGSARGDARIPG